MADTPTKSKQEALERELDKSRPALVRTLIKRYHRDFGANAARHSRRSRQWFREQATKIGKVRTSKIMKAQWIADKPKIGRLYLYQYDAKTKDTLPYWDMFPLVFFFNSWTGKNGKKYLIGINLHYLQPALRMYLFAELLSLRNEKRYRPNTRLKISWEILQRFANFKLVQPCVKKYLVEHIRSKFIEIPSEDWEIVIPLGLERFQKAASAKVWSDSAKGRTK